MLIDYSAFVRNWDNTVRLQRVRFEREVKKLLLTTEKDILSILSYSYPL